MSLTKTQLSRLKELIEEFKQHVANSTSMMYINKEEAQYIDLYFLTTDHALFNEIDEFTYDDDNKEFELSTKDLKFIIDCYEEKI